MSKFNLGGLFKKNDITNQKTNELDESTVDKDIEIEETKEVQESKSELKTEEKIMHILSYEEKMTQMDTFIINSTLKAAIKAVTNIDVTTEADMLTLPESLNLAHTITSTWEQIKDETIGGVDVPALTGLEVATQITELDLSGNEITAINPIQSLYNLEVLSINDNKNSQGGVGVLGDIDLSALKNLFELNLINSGITSVEVGTDGGLDVLHLDYNPNIDTANLPIIYDGSDPNFPKPGLLSLDNCNISDLSFLRSNTGIGTLNVSNNKIQKLDDISNLEKLINAGLDNNRIESIPIFSNLTKLDAISLNNNYIQDISPLNGIGVLTNGISVLEQNIVIGKNQNPLTVSTVLKDLNGGLPSILNISSNGQENSGVITWSNVTEETVLSFQFDNGTLNGTNFVGSYFTGTVTEAIIVSFIGNTALQTALNEILSSTTGQTRQDDQRITDVELASITGNIDLSGLQLSNIEPLQYLKGITGLNLSNNSISDLTPLSGLTNLISLDLSINEISNITPLANLLNLTTINLNTNNILDFTPLFNISGLSENITFNGQVSTESIILTQDGRLIVDISKFIPQVSTGSISNPNPQVGVTINGLTITWTNAKVGQPYSFEYTVNITPNINTASYSENTMAPLAVNTITTSGIININAIAPVTRGVKLF